MYRKSRRILPRTPRRNSIVPPPRTPKPPKPPRPPNKPPRPPRRRTNIVPRRSLRQIIEQKQEYFHINPSNTGPLPHKNSPNKRSQSLSRANRPSSKGMNPLHDTE